ncbi:MAG: mannonate dehydratase [Chloroflexota bacterium]
MSQPTPRYPMRFIPGYASSTPGIQIATGLKPDATDEEIQFVRQLGIEWVLVGDPGEHTPERYRAIQGRLAAHGLQVYSILNLHDGHNMEEVTLNLPGRERKIAAFLSYLRALGAVGIQYTRYAHMGNGIWSTEREAIRGGAMSRAFRLDQAREGHWMGKTWQAPLTHGRQYTEDELWDNYAYFIRQAAPVAEEADVYIGMHPDDPPVPVLGGVPRPIFGNFEGYRRALEIADSDHVGLCLCVGCWLEGGAWMGKTILEAIAHFGAQRRIFDVHFRNVTAPIPAGGFVETYMDAGYMDMHRVVQAFRAVGYDGVLWSDHLPQMVGGYWAAEAYAVGYLKALVQAANNEAADAAGRA